MSKAVIRKEVYLQVCEDIQKTNKLGISVESDGVFHVILS